MVVVVAVCTEGDGNHGGEYHGGEDEEKGFFTHVAKCAKAKQLTDFEFGTEDIETVE